MNIVANFCGTNFNWLVLENLPGELEIADDSRCSYNEFVKITLGRDFHLVPPHYSKIAQNFVSSSMASPLLMPRKNLKSSLKAAEDLLQESLATPENRSYFETWSKIYDFLQKMTKAKVDAYALDKICQHAINENSRVLRSFEPDILGFARKVKYSTCGSVTGRLKVVEGPQILTAPHEVRNCVRSSYEGGQVLMVDFVSVEPRVAMVAAGLAPPLDVYSDLLEEFPSLDRKAAKLVTLAALYGSSAAKLSDVTGNLPDARKSVAFVRSHFRVDSMERLLGEQADSGMVRNIFGRPLREAVKNPRIRTNHFLQSSAAELCVLLFSELCAKFDQGIRPLFVIHDALIVDVHPDNVDEFEKVANSIMWRENRMPVKVERLSPI